MTELFLRQGTCQKYALTLQCRIASCHVAFLVISAFCCKTLCHSEVNRNQRARQARTIYTWRPTWRSSHERIRNYDEAGQTKTTTMRARQPDQQYRTQDETFASDEVNAATTNIHAVGRRAVAAARDAHVAIAVAKKAQDEGRTSSEGPASSWSPPIRHRATPPKLYDRYLESIAPWW